MIPHEVARNVCRLLHEGIPIGLGLRGEHRRRYEEVRAKKLLGRAAVEPLAADLAEDDHNETLPEVDTVLDAFEADDEPDW